MGVILDSSVLIAAERGRIPLGERLDELDAEPVALSSVTASELLHGVHRARTQAQLLRRRAFVEGVLAAFPIAEFGLAEARVHARLWAELRVAGLLVGPHDLLIAAVAITLDFRLATSNLREFSRIPGLEVESWPAQ